MPINDLGNQDVSQLNRVFDIEISIPYANKITLLFKKEQLLMINNNVISRNQVTPTILNYSDIASNTIMIYDPITGTNTTISIVALLSALQQLGQ